MDALQALGVAVAGLIMLITAVGWYLLRRLKSLETDREGKRVADIKDKNAQIANLESRLTEAEEQADRVPGLEGKVTILINQMATMQDTVETLHGELDIERREKERLSAENKRLEKQNDDLFEANKLLKNDKKTMLEVVALLGLRLAEDKSDPPPTPGPTAPDSAPNELGKLPKAA